MLSTFAENFERTCMLPATRTASSTNGYTLVELLMAIAILGVIVAFAYPSYQNYVRKVNRIEAKLALLDAAERLADYYEENKTYTDDLLAVGLGMDPYITENGNYSIDVEDNGGSGGACPIAICFELVAPAIGRQAMDTDCAEFRLHASGDRTAFAGGGGQNNNCW